MGFQRFCLADWHKCAGTPYKKELKSIATVVKGCLPISLILELLNPKTWLVFLVDTVHDCNEQFE